MTAASSLVLLVMMFAVGSAAFYSKPANCVVCHEMNTYDRSWRASAHKSITCNACHNKRSSEASLGGQATLNRLVAHLTKLPISSAAPVDNNNCISCHPSTFKNIKTHASKSAINFHPAHSAAGVTCIECHKEIAHPAPGMSGSDKPQMKTCIACHKNKRLSTDCTTCHNGINAHVVKIIKAGRLTSVDGKNLAGGVSCKACHTFNAAFEMDHTGAIENVGGYTGTETCLKCHISVGGEASHNVHGKLTTKQLTAAGIDAAESRSLNPSIWAYRLETESGEIRSGGCGRCHSSNSSEKASVSAGAASSGITPSTTVECLICHASIYDMRQRKVTTVSGINKWVEDASAKTAASVGKPAAPQCLRCHQDSLVDLDGTPYTAASDVHAAQNISCQSCHVASSRKTTGSNVRSCTSCHADFKHGIASIDLHTVRLACQICHITGVTGLSVLDTTRGADRDGDGLFEEAATGAANKHQEFLWFNGSADPSGWPNATREDRKAKIYPFRQYTYVIGFDIVKETRVTANPVVFAQTGDFALAVRRAANAAGIKPPKWTRVEQKRIRQLNHGINRNGLACDACHSSNGMMDFKALGYMSDEIETLQEHQSYSK
jgi:nitrate/TMAO reductase-like tetraheme cytochrome c subunit